MSYLIKSPLPINLYPRVNFKLLHSSLSLSTSRLNPWFITGFTDAEGSFLLLLSKSNHVNVGWVIYSRFQIGLHKKDKVLLEEIKIYFGVGKVYKRDSNTYEFRVDTVKELKVILNHFDRYPLKTKKLADYMLFKQAVNLIIDKKHLTKEGVNKILAIKASLNKGLSDKLKAAFPNIAPVKRPLVKIACSSKERKEKVNPYWVAGFVSGEGCFLISIYKSPTKLGEAVTLIFSISQHIRDKQLMVNFTEWFEEGKVHESKDKDAVFFRVKKIKCLIEKLIPFFDKYQILGEKAKDYENFKQVAMLIKNKSHLTSEGLKIIRKIKSNMNRKRKS